MSSDSHGAESGPVAGPAGQTDCFLEHLVATGYAKSTVVRRERIIAWFIEWLRRKGLAAAEAAERHVMAFLRRPRRRPAKTCIPVERAAVRSYLRHLRGEFDGRPPTVSDIGAPMGALENRYVDYLRNERGITESSILVYRPHVREFLGAWKATTDGSFPAAHTLEARFVRDFLLERVRTRRRSCESVRLLASALRSFLHFLFLRGETSQDLALAVPTVRRWSLARVYPFLSPEEVERVLAATDRTTERGRRDYAILLLLARLGLRAGEVVALEIDDIHWRTAEIVVRGKGRVVAHLPLLVDVGEALSVHLRSDRRLSASRRVFLRKTGPSRGLAGQTSIGHVVRAALAKAGLRSSRRGAAHLFRHSLATRMIRQGASLGQISEILRHRSPVTTQIYAKVDFETLRGVARPWPGEGSSR